MDAYTLHLVGLLLTHERVEAFGLHIWPHTDANGGPSVHLSLLDADPLYDFRADTLEQACIDALTALDVEVPERPSRGRVAGALYTLVNAVIDSPDDEVFPLTVLRRIHQGDPLIVASLLEGGTS